MGVIRMVIKPQPGAQEKFLASSADIVVYGGERNVKEIWKDIDGYEGKYQISNLGNVKSLNYHREKRAVIMTPKDIRGYKVIGLRKGGKKRFYSIHRLVAKAFIHTNDYSLQINHKNLNKADNSVDNLEWVLPHDNTIHAIEHGRFENSADKLRIANEHRKKRVLAMAQNSGEVVSFESIREAARVLNVGRKEISLCLRGLRGQTKGYKFCKSEVMPDANIKTSARCARAVSC